MIKNIIFDFGGVFLNLNKEVVYQALVEKNALDRLQEVEAIALRYEIGSISSEAFLHDLASCIPGSDTEEIRSVWNAMLLDFPEHRLQFLEAMAKERSWRLFLLSNTNAIHIRHVEKTMGAVRFQRFKNSFERFYLSHEIHMRKPDSAIFHHVLKENGLQAQETLFIDDTEEHILSARTLGISTWHLQIGQEDIIDLRSKLVL